VFLASEGFQLTKTIGGKRECAGFSHSVVVIRGRPRPLRGMSMSSEGT
jgi:hypothetical protein